MTIDTNFLRMVQRKGWIVRFVDGEAVHGQCPRAGCTVKLSLKPGRPIPDTCNGPSDLNDIVVDTFDAGARQLREVRERYCLRILDVEECAGLATDHLAKMEKDQPDKKPNVDTFILWANALGFDVVLKWKGLPAVTIARIAESRDKVPSRRRAFRYWQELRGARKRARGAGQP